VTAVTDRDALLAAIRRDPADDTLRLAFADWCEEHGYEGWAYLIRSGGPDPYVSPPGMSCDVHFYPGPAAGTTYTVKLAEGIAGVSFVVRRGFVDEIRLPLRAFLAHAPTIFAAHPVTGVVLGDREPAQHTIAHPDGPPGNFGWWADPDDDRGVLDDHPEELPRDVWSLLIGYRPHRGTATHWKWFPTRDAALSALSLACVAHGRQVAGLSPPPAPTART